MRARTARARSAIVSAATVAASSSAVAATTTTAPLSVVRARANVRTSLAVTVGRMSRASS